MTEHLALFEVAVVAVMVVVLVAERPPGRRAADPVAAIDRGWAARSTSVAIPAVLRRLPEVRAAQLALMSLVAGTALAYPYIVSTERLFLGSVIAIEAVVVVSVVVLTGWSGQVSLAQFALAAVGAVVGGRVAASPLGFWGAIPVAMAVTAAAAALVGLPALRVHSRHLLVLTLAVSVVVSQALFEDRWFSWLLPDGVDRPTLFLVDFDGERAMYFLSLAALAATVAGVTALRRSRFGALVLAARDDPRGLTTFGVSPVRVRLLAFAVSGAVAGLAGVLLAAQLRGVDRAEFLPEASIGVFVAAAFGGIASVGGGVAAAVWFGAIEDLVTGAVLEIFLLAGGSLTLLYLAPGGLTQVATAVRQAGLRSVALRRRIPVPGLTTDVDDARVAFGPGTPVTGPATASRALGSRLYGPPGPLPVGVER